jgi:hypothetical protein
VVPELLARAVAILTPEWASREEQTLSQFATKVLEKHAYAAQAIGRIDGLLKRHLARLDNSQDPDLALAIEQEFMQELSL